MTIGRRRRLLRRLIAVPACAVALIGSTSAVAAADDAGSSALGSVAAATRDRVLPAPTGPSVVGTDNLQLVDRARGGRRLMVTRWYPATAASRRPRAPYVSARLSAAIQARQGVAFPARPANARARARARAGRLPVVLFSPGYRVPRVAYQALAEDLASHGYLVVAVDHTGEAVIEFPHGRIVTPPELPEDPTLALRATRVADMRFVLHRLDSMPAGPRTDPRRIAAIGHSLGGSTAAALMRAERTVRAGVDLDGSINDAPARRGVPGAFLALTAERPFEDPSLNGLLEHSRGPALALAIAGFEHNSFSDLPVVAPEAPEIGTVRPARAIALQRAYVRAFLNWRLRGWRPSLLAHPSPSWPEVRFTYQRR